MTELVVESDARAAAESAAGLICTALAGASSARGVAHLALAGGRTPIATYRLLAERIDDWSEIEVWFGDERCVPPQSPESNYRAVAAALLEPVAVPAEQVQRIAGELPPELAAAAYAQKLRAELPVDGGAIPILDIVLLGIGEDGHTASLFPDSPALDVTDELCLVVRDAPKPPPVRITLSLPVLRAARQIVFLAWGEAKATAVAALVAGPDRGTPASLLAGPNATAVVDRAAAGPLAAGTYEP